MILTPTSKNSIKITGNRCSNQTIIFGHGFGTDHTAWRYIIKDFEQDFRIITYDNVGAGNSDKNSYSQIKYSKLNTYADDIIDICYETDVRDGMFVGHSVSGMTGLLASIKAPEIFSRHVLINASPRYLNDINYVGGFEKTDLEQLYHAMETNYYAWTSGFAPIFMDNPERPQLAEEFAKTLSEIRPDIALAVSKVIFESDHRRDIIGFDKETLIIQSEKDMAVPMSVGQYLKDQLVNSHLKIINSKGHFPHLSSPDMIIQSIKEFI